MKLSLQTLLVILLVLNLFIAGLSLMDSLIQSSEESERMTRMPADWRYRMPRDPKSDGEKYTPADQAIEKKSPLIAAGGQ